MATTPGGASPGSGGAGAPQQPRSSPPEPDSNAKAAAGDPGSGLRLSPAQVRAAVHWAFVFGGLVIIVDLGTRVMQQGAGSGGGGDGDGVLDTLNLILNGVLFSMLGTAVYRRTGRITAAALGGMLGGLFDGAVIGWASALAPPVGLPAGMTSQDVWFFLVQQNVVLGTLLSSSSAWLSRLGQRAAASKRDRDR